MRNLTIKWKVYIPIIILFVIGLSGMTIFFFKNIQKIENNTLNKKESSLQLFIAEKFKTKEQIAITSAINLSQNKYIIDALLYNDKSIAKKELLNLANSLKDSSDYKNIKIHVHTADIKSFLRHWNDKSGDDLSSFRETIKEVKNTKKPIKGIEVGKAGLVLRGLSPIFDNYKNYIGSVELIQSFESVVKSIKKELGVDMLIGLDSSMLNVAKNLTQAPRLISNKYVVAQNLDGINKDLINELSKVGINELKDVFETKNYFVIKLPIYDFKNKQIGHIFVANKKQDIYKELKLAEQGMIEQMLVNSVTMVFIFIALMVIVKISITKPLNELINRARNLSSGDGDLTRKLEVVGKDEIAMASDAINNFIEKVRVLINDAKHLSS
ncbi:cache domain-containing protein, partial [Campylobacter pinnipediorum]|uniref:cache domain-containing protein n=4 Tax=Campylobacter pinnipediorum TaxID=1965231 RepID=UPI00112FA4BC